MNRRFDAYLTTNFILCLLVVLETKPMCLLVLHLDFLLNASASYIMFNLSMLLSSLQHRPMHYVIFFAVPSYLDPTSRHTQ